MNALKSIIIAAAISLGFVTIARAETLKPLQGVSLHAPAIDAVAYFLSQNHSCKFVLTLADSDAQPTRIEGVVAGGESRSYSLTHSKAVAFACEVDAQAMTINVTARVAEIEFASSSSTTAKA
jgi:hypothetical protein